MKTNRKEPLMRFMISISIIILSVQVISNFALYTDLVTPLDETKPFLHRANRWTLSCALGFNIFLIVFNTKTNYKYRNFRNKTSIESPLVFYVICLPIFIVVLIGLILLSQNIIIHSFLSEFDWPLYLILVIVEFFAILVLILDISGFTDSGEEWFMNYLNCLTICVTIVCMLNQAINNTLFKFALAFKYYEANNGTSDEKVYFINSSLSLFEMQAKTDAIVLLFIVLLPYLLVPLKFHWNRISELKIVETISQMSPNSTKIASFKSASGTMIAIVLLGTCVLSKCYEINHLGDYKPHQIYLIISIVLGTIAIFLAFILATEIQISPCTNTTINHRSVFRKFLIHVGTTGVCVKLLVNVSIQIYHLIILIMAHKSIEPWRYISLVLFNIEFIALFYQAALLQIISDRGPVNLKSQSWNVVFSSPVILIIINLNNLLSGILHLFNGIEDSQFTVRLFVSGVNTFGSSFVFLYQWVSVTIFASVIFSWG